MFCGKCGKQISDNASFCSGCGNKVSILQPTYEDDFVLSEKTVVENDSTRIPFNFIAVFSEIAIFALFFLPLVDTSDWSYDYDRYSMFSLLIDQICYGLCDLDVDFMFGNRYFSIIILSSIGMMITKVEGAINLLYDIKKSFVNSVIFFVPLILLTFTFDSNIKYHTVFIILLILNSISCISIWKSSKNNLNFDNNKLGIGMAGKKEKSFDVPVSKIAIICEILAIVVLFLPIVYSDLLDITASMFKISIELIKYEKWLAENEFLYTLFCNRVFLLAITIPFIALISKVQGLVNQFIFKGKFNTCPIIISLLKFNVVIFMITPLFNYEFGLFNYTINYEKAFMSLLIFNTAAIIAQLIKICKSK